METNEKRELSLAEIQAGNDVKMGCGYPERLKKDYEAGRITRDELVVSAKRVLELILKVD